MIPRDRLVVALLATLLGGTAGFAQEIERPEPPARDGFEADANGDGAPDGWYNLRDVRRLVGGVGKPGTYCIRCENSRPGRPCRISRAFGVDGRKHSAIVIGLWIKLDRAGPGRRQGDDPGLIIDFLDESLRYVGRNQLGPWNKVVGSGWTKVAKRIPVPETARDAIMSLGLLGATGSIDVDDVTFDLIPKTPATETNLAVNGDFELGDPAPLGWFLEQGARRVFRGRESDSAIELSGSGDRALTQLAASLRSATLLGIEVSARGEELRGADSVSASFFFLDHEGRVLPGGGSGFPFARWSGTFDWRTESFEVSVPSGAASAVLQFDKSNGSGRFRLDDVRVEVRPRPSAAEWTPWAVRDSSTGWHAVSPSVEIVKGSALDASAILDAPAGKHGFVTEKDGRLAFADGKRARFFGVTLIAPTAFLEPARAEALADRLARSGVNLVRIGDLDSPLGPGRSLYDDTRDDTKEFDLDALPLLDGLIAALKKRGIYVALELQSQRRYRDDDDVEDPRLLPIGGGPAAAFDAKFKARALESAKALLGRVNPETGLALKDDPALAWVTISGELSLFNLIDEPNALPPDLADALRSKGSGRRAWQTIESEQWRAIAKELRDFGVKAPIAGCSHWRREPEFSAAQAAPGLDLIDDRLFRRPSGFASPDSRGLIWAKDGGLATAVNRKRKLDRPYVLGQWCDQTFGAWANPREAADFLLGSVVASHEDWDGLVRRGVFMNPERWGASAPGTGGGEDLFNLLECLNANPAIYGLLPHASSILLRGDPSPKRATRPSPNVPGWDPKRGRLSIDTPHTQGIAGKSDDEAGIFEHLEISTDNEYAVVIASSLDKAPIARAKRLLVSAVGRVQPTGFAYVDENRRDVAHPGSPPLLREPARARVAWRTDRKAKAFALDDSGKRASEVDLKKTADGVALDIRGDVNAMHWELVAE